jgi:hypothetical protein
VKKFLPIYLIDLTLTHAEWSSLEFVVPRYLNIPMSTIHHQHNLTILLCHHLFYDSSLAMTKNMFPADVLKVAIVKDEFFQGCSWHFLNNPWIRPFVLQVEGSREPCMSHPKSHLGEEDTENNMNWSNMWVCHRYDATQQVIELIQVMKNSVMYNMHMSYHSSSAEYSNTHCHQVTLDHRSQLFSSSG